MKTIWDIFARDVRRIAGTPKVWIVVIGMMILPALYAWFNIAAFWDPYGNTGNIKIAVVNEDDGADSELTGPLDVGEQLVTQLEQNDQLGWQFMDEAEADDAVHSGDVYASITVPDDFSADVVSLFEAPYSQPTLIYQVNEKVSAVGPQITNQGANAIDQQINATLKEVVAEAVTSELSDAGGTLGNRLESAGESAQGTFAEAQGTVADARAEIGGIQESLAGADPAIAAAQDALRSADTTLTTAQDALGQVQSIMADVQRETTQFADTATQAYVEGTTAIADGAVDANASVASVTDELQQASAGVAAATRSAENVVGQTGAAIDEIQGLLDSGVLSPAAAAPLQEAVAGLQERNATSQQIVDDLAALNSDAATTTTAIDDAAQALTDATAVTRDSARNLQENLQGLPALNAAINGFNASVGSFEGSLAGQQPILRESVSLLDGVRDQIDASNAVLESFSDDLAGIEDGLGTARSDVAMLTAASQDGVLDEVSALDSTSISQFFASPTSVTENSIFPVNSYGSQMAALFTNLSLWVGAFMILLLFRTEVETAGLKRVTVARAYLGRFLLFSLLAVGQALVVSIGNLIIGVQTVNALAFVLTNVLIGQAYLAITYGLVSALGNMGRVIAVVLAFIQIPGASGLYPVEMTPDFFRAINPFLPFTHGIDAMRETIGGFYGNHYIVQMGILLLMGAVAFVAGLMLRHSLSSVKRTVNEQLADGGLVINDQVQVVGSGYRMVDIVHALRDRDEFSASVDKRWKFLRDNYSVIMLATVGIGVLGVVLLGALAGFLPEQKTLIFGLVCLWFLLVAGVVAMLEYSRLSFARSSELAGLSGDELREYASVSADRTVSSPSSKESSIENSEANSTEGAES